MTKKDAMTDSLNTVLELATLAINLPLSKSSDALLPRGYSCTDAIEALGVENFVERNLFARGREWTLPECVHQRLGHIIANPSNPEDCAALLQCYTYLAGSVPTHQA
ncbi:MAG: hypothetical protein MI867_26565, partial [Pseudomonadales bacterium]|nr:hypothetical protein [Pseudomonadales bacterium]